MHLPRPTYANVTSTLALFVALGGVSWAATTLPRNSVGSAQLKRNAVTGTDVRANAISSAKVKDRSLFAKDFKTGQLPKGAKGDTGPPGPQGTQGTQGTQGIQGIQGGKGDPGVQGPVGPTEALTGLLGLTPFDDDSTVATFNPIATTKAGKVSVQATVEREVTCGTVFRAQLTLDDVPLAASTKRFNVSGNPDVLSLEGVTFAAVQPGQHVVKVVGDCEIGGATFNTLQAATLQAVVIGS